ncbi:MAG TPA: PD-(D/E)XK nuclease family protein [Jiangellales bacterium]|nr:PD-(D/E)XK nuclease family protein [Jiangellales bacterium]
MTAPAQRAALSEKLAEIAGNPGAAAAFLRALNENLIAEAADAQAANRKGWKGAKEAVALVTGRIEIRAGWLEHMARDLTAADAPCRAVDQDAKVCVRLGPHESHTFMTPDAVASLDQASATPEDVAVVADFADSLTIKVDTETITDSVLAAVAEAAPESTCGMVYPGSADPCLLDSEHVDRGESHQARNSRWPVSPEDIKARTALSGVRTARAEVVAFLKGETDDLGTEPLFGDPVAPPFNLAPLPHDAYIAAGLRAIESGWFEIRELSLNAEPSIFPGAGIVSATPYVETGLSDRVVIPGSFEGKPFTESRPLSSVLEGTMQPDPWANATPVDTGPRMTGPGWHTPVPSAPAPFAPPPMPTDWRPTIHQSAIKSAEACGLQVRLTDHDHIPPVPTWANVGGSGVHYAIAALERNFIDGGTLLTAVGEEAARALFDTGFDQAIADADQESGGMARELWRTSAKGTEGEAWWRENGPHMVRDYAAWSAQRHADGWQIAMVHVQSGSVPPYWGPAIEVPFRFDHMGVPLEGTIDQLWLREIPGPHGARYEFELIDPKSASDVTEDQLQLALYARALPSLLPGIDPASIASIRAAYYDARNGKLKDFIDPYAVMSDEEIAYRAGAVAAMHASGAYPANPSGGFKYGSPCIICPVSYACPIMATKRPGLAQ